MKKIKEKLTSNRGDNNTISQILWIVLTVVLVITVGRAIYNAVNKKGEKAANCIENSNTVFKGTDNEDCK